MPDDPHKHPDGSFMLFAEAQVEKLIKAQRWHRVWIGIIGGVIVCLAAVSAFLVHFALQEQNIAHQQQANSVAACESANATRHGEVEIWDEFITLALKNNPKASDHAIGHEFEQFISHVEAPKNCQVLFSTSNSARY